MMRPPILALTLATALWLLSTIGAHAAGNLANMLNNLFVAGPADTEVVVIDTQSERVVGRLSLGLVPRQMELSESLAKLVAADGEANRLIVFELAADQARSIPLDFTPRRLLISPDGLTLAIADDESGMVALFDLLLMREKARLNTPPHIRDMMFAGDGKRAFLVADNQPAVTVIDVETGRLLASLPVPPATALARSANGREGFAAGANGLTHFDLGRPAVLGTLPEGAGPPFPTGTGRFLMIPDERTRSLILARTEPLSVTTRLRASGGITTAYSAWFDTVAFLPSAAAQAVSVYDLEKQEPTGTIPLPGVAGQGVVTPEGGKLFLPIQEASQVVIIDARLRRRTATIHIGFPPSQARMAGAYGICH